LESYLLVSSRLVPGERKARFQTLFGCLYFAREFNAKSYKSSKVFLVF
jgi:hypothetical protein